MRLDGGNDVVFDEVIGKDGVGRSASIEDDMRWLQQQRVHDLIETALIDGKAIAQFNALHAEGGKAGEGGGRCIGVETQHPLASGNFMLRLETGGQRLADPALGVQREMHLPNNG